MHREETRTDYGIIRIHRNVIASIASIAAVEIEGVHGVGGNLKSGILELIGQKNPGAIGVDIDKNDEVHVNIPLIIKFGFNVPEVANKVQENVRLALEKMTSVAIKDININVLGIAPANKS
ncbi:MAG TPA: Asp23/Gls24 family envelope stress response protein [Candidatus Omnitrophota bacterium]|nr:Asp23/Gls24 family envelope stress response protein [Candidatus Omnitrophota bacterium]HPT07630.1 Asp23/Gls24 family envelope stress response protein [Candidatus Omnitrophota bacterium]